MSHSATSQFIGETRLYCAILGFWEIVPAPHQTRSSNFGETYHRWMLPDMLIGSSEIDRSAGEQVSVDF